MARQPANQPANTGVFVFALGLLIGIVILSVLALSRFPVNAHRGSSSPVQVNNDASEAASFTFFEHLPGLKVARGYSAPETALAVIDDSVAEPTPAPAPVPAPTVAPVTQKAPTSRLGQESYYLQAGNFGLPDDAERARAAVLMLGLDAFIAIRRESTGAIGHRVRIGPFFDLSRLNEARQRLREGSIPYDVIRVTG